MSTVEFSMLEAQQNIPELIAHHHSLEQTLDAVAAWVGSMMPGALVSIMKFDPATNSLSLMPSDRFSDQFFRIMQNIQAADNTGTCATAAFNKQLTITDNIQEDPNWKGFHDLAEAEGVCACWSMPILTSKNELLGTFATYYRAPAKPTVGDQRNLARGAALVNLTILRNRDAKDHRTLSEWHQALFDNHPDGVFTFDLDGHFQSCNEALEEVSGYSAESLYGRHFNLFIEPDYRVQTQVAFDRARNGEVVTYETLGTTAYGPPYFLEVTNFPVIIEGEIVGVYGLCRDISERKHQETELHLLKRGMEASPNGMVMVDARNPDTPMVYVNRAFTELTGYAQDEVIGRNCRFLQGKDTAPEALDTIRQGLHHQTEVNVELINYRKNGTPFWNQLRISPVLDKDGLCTHFIGAQQDVTQQREHEAQITYQATHDLVTGLPNEARFQEALRDALIEDGGRGSLAVLYLDMDGFKSINDELGHQIANRVLRTIARRLLDLTVPGAAVARLVGDEFGLLIPGYSNRKEVTQLADEILLDLARPIDVDGQVVHLSVSIGIADNCMPLDAPHELLQFADIARKQAKRQGKNIWQWHSGQKAQRCSSALQIQRQSEE